MSLDIITNNHWRNILYSYELSARERAEFDYMEADDFECHSFIRYRGLVYDLGEFMQTLECPEMSLWDGYQPDSYFSGVLITYSADYEQVKMATYIAN